MSRPVWLVEEQINPSTDYYLVPAFSSLGWQCERFSPGSGIPGEVPQGQKIVFVRYVPAAWVKLIERFREAVGEVILFIDDDILDISASRGLPLRYRYKLASQSASRKAWMSRHDVKLWVSTRYLQEKYADRNPRLVYPSPLPEQQASTIFYHGSAAHDAEIRWLRPVIEEVLARDERAHFELIGGRDVHRLYRGLSRVSVVHPMKWPAYQNFLAQHGRSIGLAPVLSSPFNRARSYTKFFDITRTGAAGVYSRDSVFNAVVSHGSDGLLQSNSQSEWSEAILSLLNDPVLRISLAARAKTKLDEMLMRARESYKCLC